MVTKTKKITLLLVIVASESITRNVDSRNIADAKFLINEKNGDTTFG